MIGLLANVEWRTRSSDGRWRQDVHLGITSSGLPLPRYHLSMDFAFGSRQALTSADTSRPVATTLDTDFTLSIDEALQRYVDAGLPRTPRSIQRYCALGHLESRRVDTPFGQKWLVTPASVDRHIAYIKEVTPTGRDPSRPDATSRDNDAVGSQPNLEVAAATDDVRQAPTGADPSRPVATTPDTDRYVSRLEGENEFLRGQIAVKDVQIKDLTERARETNHLIAGLQRMLSPLLGTNGSHPSEPRAGEAQ